MPLYSTRHLGPAVFVVVLLLLPGHAAAERDHQNSVTSAAERRKPALLFKLRDLLSALWAENGSILDPNGTGTGTSSGDGTGENPASGGDNGSILDPDGLS